MPTLMSRAGRGHVALSHSSGRTRIIRAAATSPLKLLVPRTHGDAAWIFSSTFGGGMVGGDSVHLSLNAGPNTRCMLSTQASTKIYRTIGPSCRAELNATLAAGSILICAPDPLVCYRGARYLQHQQFHLAASAGLVLIDTLTSGRHARGERWAFDRYHSLTEVFFDQTCIFRDRIELSPAHGPIDDPMRMGPVDCFATVVVAGDALQPFADELLACVDAQPAPAGSVLFAASAINHGVVIRVAGRDGEAATQWIRQRLAFISRLAGYDPWARKW